MGVLYSATSTLPTDLEKLVLLEGMVAELLSAAPTVENSELVHYNLTLATHELCVNIIEHAFNGVQGDFTLRMSLRNDPLRFEAETEDRGSRVFSNSDWSPPKLDDTPVRGLGIWLIRQLMDFVLYTNNDGVNHWRIVKQLQPAPQIAHVPAQAIMGQNGTAGSARGF
ncbi:MAG: ATP-binding protein [Caldilineaceae bacterium]|nr:ATP-binding protein [Caldilineaceae bacterium]